MYSELSGASSVKCLEMVAYHTIPTIMYLKMVKQAISCHK